MGRNKLIRDRSTELGLGIGFFLLASWLIWDSYEGRGRQRPWVAHFLP